MNHRTGRDDGASLILVLVVVTVIAVAAAALLSLVGTSLRTTTTLRDKAAAEYLADGAAQAAINNIRNSDYNASSGQHCFKTTDTLTLENFTTTASSAASAAVGCTADPAKTLIQCPSLANCNRPGNAILTLGGEGLNIQQPTGSTFRVHGTVFSNSTIKVDGTLNTNTGVYARVACTGPGTIVSTPAARCGYTTPDPLGDDPNYATATGTVPVHRDLPACATSKTVIAFEPGYYDDAVGLSKMMDGSGACRDNTWWFKPGTYYFDFHNSVTAGRNPLLPSGTNEWTIDNGRLVAGTLVDPAGAAAAKIPGACDNPIRNDTAQGVQFIFGGDSQLSVKAGAAEICGTYSRSTPPVAIYGLRDGTEKATALTALKPTATKLAEVDGIVESWKSTKNNDTGSMTVSGFAPPSAIPAGSMLTKAEVRVRHRHSDATTKDRLTVTLTPNGGTAVNSATLDGGIGDAAFRTDTFTLDSAATGGLARSVYAGTFTAAAIELKTTLNTKNDTEDVDAIQLDLTYTPPAFRAGTGCVAATPYTGTGNTACALVSTVTNAGGQLYVQGTTYAPKAAIDITLNNAAEQVFRFGVVARTLSVKLTGSFNYPGVVIEVPDDAPGFVFSVYLTVHVCPGAGTCDTSGAAVLRVRVAFIDTHPDKPTEGRRQVVVLSWSPG